MQIFLLASAAAKTALSQENMVGLIAALTAITGTAIYLNKKTTRKLKRKLKWQLFKHFLSGIFKKRRDEKSFRNLAIVLLILILLGLIISLQTALVLLGLGALIYIFFLLTNS